MKKVFALLTVIVMLFALVSCGESDVKGTISGDLSGKNTGTEQEELQLGKVSGQTYENAFLDLTLTMGDEWYFYNEEEIAAVNNLTFSEFDEDYSEKIKKADLFYDVMAQNIYTRETVNVVFEKVTAASLLLNEEKYIDVSIDNFSNLGADSNITVITCEKDMDSTLGERNVPSLYSVMDYSGVMVYERSFVFKKGMYFATLTIASYSEEGLNNIVSGFTTEN